MTARRYLLLSTLALAACAAALLPADASAAPNVTVTSNVVEATSNQGGVPNYVLHITDDHNVTSTSCSPSSDHLFPLGNTTVNCTISDDTPMTVSYSFTVTVGDSTGPAFSNVPAAQTIAATSASGAALLYTAPTAIDAVDGARPVTCSPASGSTFPIGTSSVTCSSSDSRGNTSNTTFSVKVADTTAPALTLPAAQTAEATSSSGAAVSYTATAADKVDGAVTPTCSPASGATFTIGATTVTCTALDKAGNKATGTFTVTVLDTTAPTITAPAKVKVTTAKGKKTAMAKFSATASDAVEGTVATTCKPKSGSAFKVGTTKVTCTATDAHGNTATQTISVVVTRKR